MKISIIGSTMPGYIASNEATDIFCGKIAGVCYMANDFFEIDKEDVEKTKRRISQTKSSGHHSVYDHAHFNLYFEGIPKIVAMFLNNEKMYTTSEKSARYTKMQPTEKELVLYNKWLEIFKIEIEKKYGQAYSTFFSPSRIEKLAQENARLLISVFTPTSMVYTVSYRQLNYLYGFIKNLVDDKKLNGKFYDRLKESFMKLLDNINSLGVVDKELALNGKNRELSLFNDNKVREYFGDVYVTNYNGSFAQLAQAHRHRTLSYSFKFLPSTQFYIPPIIAQNKELAEMWNNDILSVADEFPQGQLLNICEMGSMDNFILKMYERKCTFAQLEINQQTSATLLKYYEALKASAHPKTQELAKYLKGSRCTFENYVCPSPCGFADGIKETRCI